MPNIIQNIVMTFSAVLTATISPKPTVVSVCKAQYIAARYCIPASLSWYPNFTTQQSGLKSSNFACKNHMQPIRCIIKNTLTVTVTIFTIPVFMFIKSNTFFIVLFDFSNLSSLKSLRILSNLYKRGNLESLINLSLLLDV